jgi:hypothetical protein
LKPSHKKNTTKQQQPTWETVFVALYTRFPHYLKMWSLYFVEHISLRMLDLMVRLHPQFTDVSPIGDEVLAQM